MPRPPGFEVQLIQVIAFHAQYATGFQSAMQLGVHLSAKGRRQMPEYAQDPVPSVGLKNIMG